MIKTILVPSRGTAADSAVFAAALATARKFDAHIDVLHVRLNPVVTAMMMATDSAAGTVVPGLVEELERDATTRATRARKSFETFCARAKVKIADAPGRGNKGPTAEWHVESGEEARWFVTYAQTADLIVAPRAGQDDPSPRSLLEAMLLESGRPVLIPSAKTPPANRGDTVAIGWKPGPQCARAIAAAMPFITRAKKVTVMCVDQGESDPREAAERLVHGLAWHGISAEIERLRLGTAGAAATLLAGAARKAGLLVMGGYGHTRLREWVFGGFTQHALANALLPVLMAH